MQSLSMTEYGNTFRELSMSGGWPITDSLMSKTVTVKTDPCSGKHDLGNGEMNLNVGHECASWTPNFDGQQPFIVRTWPHVFLSLLSMA